MIHKLHNGVCWVILLLALAFLLTGCNYWVVEDAPVQVGGAQPLPSAVSDEAPF